MAQQPKSSKAMQVAALRLYIANSRRKKAGEKNKQKRVKEAEKLARAMQGLQDIEAGRKTEEAAYALGLLALVPKEDLRQLMGEAEEQPSEGDPNERARAQSGAEDDAPDDDEEDEQQDDGPEPDRSNEADDAREQLKEKVKEEVVDRVKKKLLDEAKKRAARLLAQAWKAVLVFLAEWWWVILIILAVIAIGIFIWQYFGGHTQKGIGVSGGSTPIMAYADKHQELLDDINGLRESGTLVFAGGTEQDLVWVTKDKVKQSQLDIRTLQTLKYLGSKWDLVRVRVSKGNGPDATRRGDPLSYSVQGDSGVKAQAVGDAKNVPLDTLSAYSTGQAIGIDQIGTFSDEIAAVPECLVTTDTPVDVGYQEIVSESSLRPIYEQLGVDGSALYTRLTILAASNAPLPTQEDFDANKSENIYVVAQRRLALAVDNLSQLASNGDGWGIDSRALAEFGEAAGSLRSALDYIKDKRGDALATAWQDQDRMYKPITAGINAMWHATQSANMIGWRGDKKDGCKLWKAYEARENVRQMVVDLMNMPADPMFAEADRPFDTVMVPAQIIVYGFEDAALDDGLPRDVFPGGRVRVDDTGAIFDASATDGTVGIQDQHFVGLPQDKGVFARPGTIYIYKGSRAGLGTSVLADLASSGAAETFQKLWDGADLSAPTGDVLGRVSYKKFVFIAF